MDNNIVTYSRSISLNLSQICSNNHDFCGLPEYQLDQSQYELMVPYSSIKTCIKAKAKGVKEVHLVSGERPDNFGVVRARLDLWGFGSFIEYVYTVCELVFLEGFIPCIDIGYITPKEMAIIRRMTAAVKMMINSADPKILQRYFPRKSLRSRVEVIKSAGEGKVPVTTGMIVGMGETKASRKDAFELITKMHERYGNIQNVVLQNFDPTFFASDTHVKQAPTQDEMLEVAELALKMLPKDVQVTIPGAYNLDIKPFIDLGIRDIGRFDVFEEKNNEKNHDKYLTQLEKQLKRDGLGLQRRLPIFSKYIAENWYSRKLAQVLDRYKALLVAAEEEAANDGEEKEHKAKKPGRKPKAKA